MSGGAVMTGVEETLQDLERALNAPGLMPRYADGCARLLKQLRRPVRIGVFGVDAHRRESLLEALIGMELLPDSEIWPTVEIGYGAEASTHATLPDGSKLTARALPDAVLLAQGPVLLQVSAPLDTLKQMSFLCPAAGPAAAEQRTALAWAASRTDISLWCTGQFGPSEQAIWTQAPAQLKNHAYLIVAGRSAKMPDGLGQAGQGFDDVIALSESMQAPDRAETLRTRLKAHIDAARQEDVDAARMLLHRCALPPAPEVAARASDPSRDSDGYPGVAGMTAAASDADLAVLSEPFLYLKRRARNLAETLDWADETEDDWAPDVLTHCNETAQGLLDRTFVWPEDNPLAVGMRDMISEAAEMAVLLQVEGGRAQAEDAAVLLCQLRTEFESRLARPGAVC